MEEIEFPPVKIHVKQQGAPLVNHAYIIKKSDDIVCIVVDLESKYCEIIASTGFGVMISANENSLYLNNKCQRDDLTWIEFPEYEEWSYFSGSLGRYTLSVCFIKRDW